MSYPYIDYCESVRTRNETDGRRTESLLFVPGMADLVVPPVYGAYK
jgi:hypothetical protein